MTKQRDTVGVKDGKITRDSVTGRFIKVATSKGVSRSSAKTLQVVEGASSRRGEALKRLADR